MNSASPTRFLFLLPLLLIFSASHATRPGSNGLFSSQLKKSPAPTPAPTAGGSSGGGGFFFGPGGGFNLPGFGNGVWGGYGGGGGGGFFFGPGGRFNLPGFGNWGGYGGGYGGPSDGFGNGVSGGYGGGGPSGGYGKGWVVRPAVTCMDRGPCYKKQLQCPAKCFTSYSWSGNNYGGGGGGGGCTMDCKEKCVAYC